MTGVQTCALPIWKTPEAESLDLPPQDKVNAKKALDLGISSAVGQKAGSDKTETKKKTPPEGKLTAKEANAPPLNTKAVKDSERKKDSPEQEKTESKSTAAEEKVSEPKKSSVVPVTTPEKSGQAARKKQEKNPGLDLQSDGGDDSSPAEEPPNPNDAIDWLLKQHAEENKPR